MAAGYRFFIYDPNDGECLYEMTNSTECPEGLEESSYYDFYASYLLPDDVTAIDNFRVEPQAEEDKDDVWADGLGIRRLEHEHNAGEAFLSYTDLYNMFTDNAADICYDPRYSDEEVDGVMFAFT